MGKQGQGMESVLSAIVAASAKAGQVDQILVGPIDKLGFRGRVLWGLRFHLCGLFLVLFATKTLQCLGRVETGTLGRRSVRLHFVTFAIHETLQGLRGQQVAFHTNFAHEGKYIREVAFVSSQHVVQLATESFAVRVAQGSL